MSLYDSSSLPIIVNFNSFDRISGSNSDFISKPVNLGINDYDSVALIQASIPRTFYNIPSGYNTFIVRENGVERQITLTPASYTKDNLITSLVEKLNVGSYVYTMSYSLSSSPDTFHYTFSVNSDDDIFFIFDNSLYRQLGFNNSTYQFSSRSLESVNCIDLSYINRVYVRSDVIDENDSILESILSYGTYQMLSFCHHTNHDYDLVARRFNKNKLNSWRFTLTNAFNEIVDLNGIPWCFTLVFYKRNISHELHKNDLVIKQAERQYRFKEEIKKLQEDMKNMKNMKEEKEEKQEKKETKEK